MTQIPMILVDEPEDGYVESFAWVEKTDDMTPERAVTQVEAEYPVEDRGEEERYICEGKVEYLRPEDDADPDDDDAGFIPWVDAPMDDERSKPFYVVKVVCAA